MHGSGAIKGGSRVNPRRSGDGRGTGGRRGKNRKQKF